MEKEPTLSCRGAVLPTAPGIFYSLRKRKPWLPHCRRWTPDIKLKPQEVGIWRQARLTSLTDCEPEGQEMAVNPCVTLTAMSKDSYVKTS